MLRGTILASFAAVAILAGASALAKQYDDYVPEKGVWNITAVEVDPNHVDEYLTGLRKSQVPGFEVMKAHGMIDDYRFVVRNGYNKGSPNVLIQVHFTSFAMLGPDEKRDRMIEKEITAKFSEEAGKAAIAGYEKYRQFVDDGLWSEMKMVK
jgi:hypothetical protein